MLKEEPWARVNEFLSLFRLFTSLVPRRFFVKRISYSIQCCIYRSVPKFASARGFLGEIPPRRVPPKKPRARSQTLVLIYIYNTELSIIFSLQEKRLGTRLWV